MNLNNHDLHERDPSGQSLVTGTGIGTCDGPEGLAAISRPDMELMIWRRAVPHRLTTWLEKIGSSRHPDARILVEPSNFRRAIEPHLDECGMPAGRMREYLVGDIDFLVSAFDGITKSGLVDVRLERISHDACWKFHRDCVEARLLTTYYGPTTEWVQPPHAARALWEQQEYKGPIEHLRIHDVAIFKGSCAASGNGIVHRSPPIAGTGRTRLLLCLNTRSPASPEPWPRES